MMNAVKRTMTGCLERVFSGSCRLSVFLFVLVFSSSSYSACTDWIARVVSIQGSVDVRVVNTADWKPVALQQTYCSGDTIRVQANSRAALELHNDTILRLNQSSTLVLSGPKKEASWLDLLKGSLHSISRVPRSLKVNTPFVNAAVEGTEFLVQVSSDNTLVGVIEGKVAVANEYGRILLAKDQSAITYKGKAPVLRLDIRPADSVQWSLYYPSLNVAALKPAEELLRVGQVDAASALLQGLDSAEALALRSIIAIARNNKVDALKLAEQAIKTDATSAAAHLAHSHALQASFDLPAAKAAAQQAVKQDSGHALAWARLAELHLSLAELDEGLAAAKRAVELQPTFVRTQTILGFAHLLQYETAQAKQAFIRSIELDSADPLARLGNGLATIREGDLQQGRREIEIAASLDTNNSLIRSYLGKAYYEEGRSELAAEQFALAKQMDPNDPTPWLYDTLRKQGDNNPVDALQDLHQSVSLNKKRAVYRSALNIDDDLAVRNTGLAQLYNELGLPDVAINSAAESLAQTPDNHAAHRFLADAYTNRSRHEAARTSEVLQSQLLQPLGVNPIQPQAAESNLNIVDIVDSVQSSFNEYSSLYVKDGLHGGFSALVGNNSLASEQLLLSGLHGRWAFNVGQYHYDTDGFRPGADISHDIYSAYLQHRLTNNLDIQLEYRDRETDQGDLRQYFVLNPTPSERQFLDQQSLRLGVNWKISQRSRLLFSITDIDRTTISVNTLPPPNPIITDQFDREGQDIQLQYLHKAETYNLTAGLGKYDFDSHNVESLDFGFFQPPPTITDDKFKQDLAYLYVNLLPRDDLIATLGVSYSKLERGDWQREFKETDPKFGLVWQATDRVKLRLAAFETMKRILLVNQTLEPTQVAGFNQFYDDANAAAATLYGLGIDVTGDNDLYYGFEIIDRDVAIPQSPTATVSEIDKNEEHYRFYWGKGIGNTLILSGSLEHSRYKGVLRTPVAQLDELQTTIMPVSLKYLHDENYFAELTATHVRQKLRPAAGFTLAKSSESFNLLDVSFGYRFPQRYGVFSIGIKNVLDKSFVFQDESIVSSDRLKSESSLFPERSVVASILINF